MLKRDLLLLYTFMPLIDYGDIGCLHSLDTVYHGALRFITNLKALTHHCFLYARVGWTALSIWILNHWHVLIYKAILNILPSYLWMLIHQNNSDFRSVTYAQGLLSLSVPIIRLEIGKRGFRCAAPAAWNLLQTDLGLWELVSLGVFKNRLKKLEVGSSGCRCFL